MLRQRLGADVKRVYEQVDDILNSEDAIVVLADPQRSTFAGDIPDRTPLHGGAAGPDTPRKVA